MSALRRAAEDYLQMRRALGYKLESHGQLLAGFISYLEQAHAATVTIELAVAWASEPAGADPVWWAKRLSVARQFARHVQTIDPACDGSLARCRLHGCCPTAPGERLRIRTPRSRSPR